MTSGPDGEDPPVGATLAAVDPETRRLAVQRLVGGGDAGAPALLLRALADADWRVRKEAAAVAPRVEPRSDVLTALVGALSVTDDIGLRNAVVEALVAVGSDAVQTTVARIPSLDADGKKLVAEVLAGIPDARGVDALGALLSDPDANVRAAAAEGLGRAGLAGVAEREQAISALTTMLGRGDDVTTLAVLDALAHLDAKLPWSALEPFVNVPLFRRHAVLAAARSREEAALVALVYAVGDPVTAVAHDATLALASWLALDPLPADVLDRARVRLRSAPRARTKLIALAEGDGDRKLGSAALVVLGMLAEPADAEVLVRAASDEELAEGAALGLELFGHAATGPALAALPSAPDRVRRLVLEVLIRAAPSASAELVAGLRRELSVRTPDVLCVALHGLAAFGDREDISALARLTRHSDEPVAFAAAAALREVARRDPASATSARATLDPQGPEAIAGAALVAYGTSDDAEAIAFLERVLTHEDPRARRVALGVLAEAPALKSVEPIAFALADEEREVRLAAVRALGQAGRASPLVEVVARADDVELVVTALRALGEADRARAFTVARPLVLHRDPALASAGVEAVDRFGEGAPREDALFEALAHDDVEVVKLALASLAKSPDARVLARLGLSLDHASWEVRRLASDLLGRSKDPAAHALLRARLDLEQEPVVREALARALSVRPPSGFEGS